MVIVDYFTRLLILILPGLVSLVIFALIRVDTIGKELIKKGDMYFMID